MRQTSILKSIQIIQICSALLQELRLQELGLQKHMAST